MYLRRSSDTYAAFPHKPRQTSNASRFGHSNSGQRIHQPVRSTFPTSNRGQSAATSHHTNNTKLCAETSSTRTFSKHSQNTKPKRCCVCENIRDYTNSSSGYHVKSATTSTNQNLVGRPLALQPHSTTTRTSIRSCYFPNFSGHTRR